VLKALQIRIHASSNFLSPESNHVKENEVIQAMQILACGPHENRSSYPGGTRGSFFPGGKAAGA
jgi:hypothetical protein